MSGENNSHTVDSDNETNSSIASNDSTAAPRVTRKNAKRLAKKSTAVPPPAPAPEPHRAAVTRRQAAMAVKEKNKFLDNFNPDTSVRERRKLDKKLQQKKLYGLFNDQRGVHIVSGVDLCDCLEINCPGCFFRCRRCGSAKCGAECRVNRKTKYESIEYHGYNVIKTNPVEKL